MKSAKQIVVLFAIDPQPYIRQTPSHLQLQAVTSTQRLYSDTLGVRFDELPRAVLSWARVPTCPDCQTAHWAANSWTHPWIQPRQLLHLGRWTSTDQTWCKALRPSWHLTVEKLQYIYHHLPAWTVTWTLGVQTQALGHWNFDAETRRSFFCLAASWVLCGSSSAKTWCQSIMCFIVHTPFNFRWHLLGAQNW